VIDLSKCIFCGETKTYFTTDGICCDKCRKLRRICKACDGELEYITIRHGGYRGYTGYVCKECGTRQPFLRRDENEDFNGDPVEYTNCLIRQALNEYDKKFKALLLMMVQKGMIKDLNELEDVIKSMDVLDTLKDS
jgi:hypothetical protein